MIYIKHIFFILFFFIQFSYAQSPLDSIRGYQFGENYNTILQKELQKKEYQIIPSRTNKNQLVYQGTLFNKSVNLIYYFRKRRLSKIAYLWKNNTNNTLFYQYLQELLASKYNKPQYKEIKALTSTLEINSYIQYITNKKEIIPSLYISLEKIVLTNTENIFLEFKAFDSDAVIKNKILLEDI